MHELGIVIQIVKQLDSYMTLHKIERIETVVLEIGALSSVYPKYIEDVYPIAIEKTRLSNTKLEIEVSPGIGKCMECDFVYNLVENNNQCPRCSAKNFSIISGKQFLIKQIVVEDESEGG
jgi:hydrogenase nickel incorporation protein HypA/HybF